MRRWSIVWLVGLWAMWAAAVAAAEASPQTALARYFESVDTLRGEFVQETRDESGNLVERAEGHFTIDRPGRFNWVYETPYEQRIVADGKWLWVYDVGLQQVTVRPVDQVLGVGPALLLSGSYEDLRSRFAIAAGQGGWLTLTPRDERWDFQSARLRLEEGVPVAVTLDDGLGQTIRVELSSMQRNVAVPEGTFETQAPEGADVIAPPEYSGG